jgi:hypothetical protein
VCITKKKKPELWACPQLINMSYTVLYCTIYIVVIKLLQILAVIKLFSILNVEFFLKIKSDAPHNAQKFKEICLKRNYELACPKAWYLVSPCDVLIKGVQNYLNIFSFFPPPQL